MRCFFQLPGTPPSKGCDTFFFGTGVLEAFGLAGGERAATFALGGSETFFGLRSVYLAVFSFVRRGGVSAAGGDGFSGAGDSLTA